MGAFQSLLSNLRIPHSRLNRSQQYKHMISACEQGEHVKLTSYHARVDLGPPLHGTLMGKDKVRSSRSYASVPVFNSAIHRVIIVQFNNPIITKKIPVHVLARAQLVRSGFFPRNQNPPSLISAIRPLCYVFGAKWFSHGCHCD
jgi:hypothetical protein